MQIKADKIVAWIRDQVRLAGAKGCIFGLSGGLDSSVVGVLCKKAFPDNSLGLLLPCISHEKDLRDASRLADKFHISTKFINLGPAYNQLYIQLEGKPYDGKEMNLALANLKARLRMVTLYYHANKQDYLVVGTGNRSELVMGYFTKYGDAGVDLLPLAGILKSQVRELAKELDIPSDIIDKVPTAGLWVGQTDEGEMGISYAELDRIILGLDNKELAGLDPALVKKVQDTLAGTEHKRKMPPIYQP